MITPYYSVVVPVYRGSETVKELFEQLREFFNKLGQPAEVIFVNDCSPDDSWEIILSLQTDHNTHVSRINLVSNVGQHAATICGLHHAKGTWIITMDDDLQHPVVEIKKLIAKQQEAGADLVYGVFEKKKHSVLRNLGSKIASRLHQWAASGSGQLSAFRLIQKDVIKELPTHFPNNPNLDEMLHWYSFFSTKVEVDHKERGKGKSGYSILKLTVMLFSYSISYTVLPLRIMTYTGLTFSIVFFCIGMFYIYQKLFRFIEIGFTSIIVAIFFSASLILLSLGIIGEYISRLYRQQHSKPLYRVKEIR